PSLPASSRRRRLIAASDPPNSALRCLLAKQISLPLPLCKNHCRTSRFGPACDGPRNRSPPYFAAPLILGAPSFASSRALPRRSSLKPIQLQVPVLRCAAILLVLGDLDTPRPNQEGTTAHVINVSSNGITSFSAQASRSHNACRKRRQAWLHIFLTSRYSVSSLSRLTLLRDN
ncbi:hypothetical protein EJB05_57301, partial [Eragrostis curvula]